MTRVKGVPAGSVQGLEWRPGSEELGFNLTSPKTPWNAFSVNLLTGRVERWTRADTGSVDVSKLADAELITWKSFDGREISGFMYRPPAAFTGPRPVLINVHGGPETQERPRFLGRSNYLLNELGFAVIYPNIRGSAGFGKSFLALDNGVLRENAVKDLGALLDWIGRQKQLDASRVTIAGPSYGGLMALSVAAMYPDRIRCVFDGFGISNIATFLDRAQASIRPVRRGEYGDESNPEMRLFMVRICAGQPRRQDPRAALHRPRQERSGGAGAGIGTDGRGGEKGGDAAVGDVCDERRPRVRRQPPERRGTRSTPGCSSCRCTYTSTSATASRARSRRCA